MDVALRAIADPTRRRILGLVWDRERTAGDVASRFEMSQPAISQHLKVLLDAGLVTLRPAGTRRYYRANHQAMAAVRQLIEGFWDERLAALKEAAEAEQRRMESPTMTTMTEAESGTIRRDLFIAADQAVVFAFLTDADKMTRWMGVDCELEPRRGGVYLVNVNHRDVARGEYEEVTPNSRVVFSFGWEGGAMGLTPGASRVEIDLAPKDGGTQLTFVHRGLPEAAIGPHTEGWTHYLGRLAIVAAGGDAGPDPKVTQPGD